MLFICSPARPNLGGGGETCAETGINIFFSKVLLANSVFLYWVSSVSSRLEFGRFCLVDVLCL